MNGKPKLGFVGIGLMGEAMVRRLLDRGYPVTVWNREPARLKTLVPHGAVAAGSPAEVAAASELVLMCVLNTEAVEACVFGNNGIASKAHGKQILIDLSTADPAKTRDMAARLKRETGMGWVDTPLSGGPVAAREGNDDGDDRPSRRPLKRTATARRKVWRWGRCAPDMRNALCAAMHCTGLGEPGPEHWVLNSSLASYGNRGLRRSPLRPTAPFARH